MTNRFAPIELPTGSLIKILGVPSYSEDRYLDPPTNALRRADAWSWNCGCAAEPYLPGRFHALPCEAHRESLELRFARRLARLTRYGYDGPTASFSD